MRSLRGRLVLALGVLAAVVSIAATVVAYATTDQQLSNQLDGSLQQAANQLVADPQGLPLGSGERGAAPAAGIGANPGPAGVPGSRPPGLFNLVVAQRLRPNGSIGSKLSAIGLPVNATDRSIASSGSGSSTSTAAIDGTPYRIVTIGTPGGGAVQVAQSLAEIDGVLASLRWRFGALDAALIVVAGLIAWRVARRVTTPLELLASTAEQVTASGSLDWKVPVGGRDEVGRLGSAFSAMLAALRTSRVQQQRLVRDAGHELRTPLTSVRSNVELLRRHGGDLSSTQRERLLKDLDAEVAELSSLIDEVLELATDTRSAELPVDVLVDELVERVAARLRSRLGRDVTVDARPFQRVVPRRMLERAVSNLLENAAKFSPSTAPIEVEVVPSRITVRDHGPGFDPVDLPLVFERFYRAETARSLPGSGLGLSIVQQIAREIGGEVHAANHPDGGAVVTIELSGGAT